MASIATQRSKLTLKDLGNPQLVKTANDDQLKATKGVFILGYLVGKASGFVERTKPNDNQKFEGLKGTFRMIPLDPDGEEIESGVCFIPDAFHNLIAERVRAAQKADPNAEVAFTFEVGSIKATNPQGYSWSFRPAKEFAGAHPLDSELQDVAKLVAQRQKALPAPGKSR